jgi:hypothetical protein
MLSQRPISDTSLSSAVFNATGSLALAPAIPVFALSGSEKFSGSLALTPAISVFTLTGVSQFLSGSFTLYSATPVFSMTDAERFIVASMALTQPGNSTISLSGTHNSLTMWQPPVINNTRQRQVTPVLQRLRQNEPTLKQIRQSLPMLGE